MLQKLSKTDAPRHNISRKPSDSTCSHLLPFHLPTPTQGTLSHLHYDPSGARTSDVDVEEDSWQGHLAEVANEYPKRRNFYCVYQAQAPMTKSTTTRSPGQKDARRATAPIYRSPRINGRLFRCTFAPPKKLFTHPYKNLVRKRNFLVN